MARTRRVGKYATFTPPTFLEGAAQIVDVWGESSNAGPPRILYVRKRAPAKAAAVIHGTGKMISVCLSKDVRRVGGDLSASIACYGKRLPLATAEKVRYAVESAEKQVTGTPKVR